MVNYSNSTASLLAQWLRNLVEILRLQQSSTWRDLVLTVSGKSAAIELDGTQLQLRAEGGERLEIYIESVPQQPINFRSDAETIRDIMMGYLTVDGAVATGKIYLRGDLNDLLGIHKVVVGILADGAVNPQLQRLWEDFDQVWDRPFSPPLCRSLESQKVFYGELVRQIPEDVLLIDVDD
ncbi:hypothetical protein [Microcoleus sp. herbarium14]|uniref:hypothetical protein n=1 Tax=Microcoleus sp. herbarium14 TaxID=3055439 RepID=UPI002FD641CE